MQKSSSNTSITDNNACYNFDGAITTDKDGKATTDADGDKSDIDSRIIK